MSVYVKHNGAYSPEHKLHVEIPNSWEIHDKFGKSDENTVMKLKHKDGNWPNIEVTWGGRVQDPSIEITRRFAHSFLAENGWPLIEERNINVAGLAGYEISYEHQFPRWMFWMSRAQGYKFCKVAFVREHMEYLVQLAAEDWHTDKPLFDKFVQSLHFDMS